MLQSDEGDPSQPGSMYSPGSGRKKAPHQFDQDGQSTDPYSSNWSTDDPNNHDPGTMSEPGSLSGSKGKNRSGGTGSYRGPQAPIMESDPIGKKGQLKPKYKFHTPKETDNDSIIVKGTQAALDESVHVTGDVDTVNEIDKTSNLACIEINSPRFSGYLVAALGKNRQIDQAFLDMVRERLFNFLRTHGEVVSEADSTSISLNLQEVEFEAWAFEQAEFLRKSIHEGDEIAMAFFPSSDTKVRIEDSVSEKMVKMTLDDLKDDTTVEFDLYIYMPENNKYLLYTPQGRPIYKDQKSRLTQKGVTHMHLRKESVSQVKKYKVQNFLNDKIEMFKKVRDSQQPR